MAGRGPAPKNPADRVRRNKEPERTVVEADGKVRGPDLPELADEDGGVYEWPAPTLAWWENWRRSPQATVLGPVDWDYLLETALLHAKLWEGDSSVAGELRLRVAKFGATPEDRLRLKMTVAEPEGKDRPAKKTSARRANLRVVDGTAS